MESAYELRALDYVGWPFGRLAARLHSDPLRRMRLVELRDELRVAFTTPVNAQQAHVDNALQHVTEDAVRELPSSWQRSVREAGRSRADDLPQTLGDSLRDIVPTFNQVPAWWWIVRTWQYLLVVGAVLGLAWLGTILAFGVFEFGDPPVAFLGDTSIVWYVVVLFASTLGLGALTASVARNIIALSSVKHGDRMEKRMREGIGASARVMVIDPIERELAAYKRFREDADSAIKGIGS